MDINDFLDEMIESSRITLFEKKSDDALLDAFNQYYKAKRNKTVSYMPLLIYCLAYKEYLHITDELGNENDHVLFHVTLSPNEDPKNDINGTIKRIKYVIYRIPEEELTEWEDVIEYYKKDFSAKVDKQNEKTLLYDLLVKGQEGPLSTEYQQLFEYTQNVMEVMKTAEHLPHFVTALNNHLSHIDLWSNDKMKDEKMLRFAEYLLEPCLYSNIFNPFSGPCFETLFLNQTQRFVGYTHMPQAYYLGKLIMLTQNKWFNNKLDIFPHFTEQDETFDYAIVDLRLDLKSSPFYDAKDAEVNAKVLTVAIEKLKEQGELFCIIPKPIDFHNIYRPIIQKLLRNKWIKEIISFQNDLVMLIISKDTETFQLLGSNIKYTHVNESYNYYDFEDWENKKAVEYFDLTLQDIAMENYSLTYNLIAKRVTQKEEQEDFTFLRLGCFLKRKDVSKTTSSNSDTQLLLEDIFSTDLPNYPLEPFITKLNGESIDEKGKYALPIQKTSLIFDSQKLSPFEPRIYDDTFGDALTDADFLTIDTNKVDPEYLILELSKSYFQVQLKQSIEANKKWRLDIKDILCSLYIKVPNCQTSLERQKQIVASARWKHIEKVASSINQDLSIFSIADSSYLKEGTFLRNEKYSIQRPLGHGGFGRTYLATNNDPQIGEPYEVAIKEFFVNEAQLRNPHSNEIIPRPGKAIELTEKARKKFHHEAKKIQKLSSCRYVINVFDVFDENNTTYYVMEYLGKGDLQKYTELMKRGDGLEEATAIRIIREVAEALKAMHDIKMNHLDVKPSNILIDNDGHARLIDFGTVRDFGEGNKTTTLNVASQDFSAPEVRDGSLKSFSPQADIYSLGKTLKYMLQGEEAPADQSMIIMNTPTENHPSRLDELIDRCTSFSPADRPKDIDEFLSLLD